MNLTDKQLDILRHMLGINTPWDAQPKPSRDYFCANPGDAMLAELDRLGMVTKYSERAPYHWYRCTDAGRAIAMRSHRSIRYTKAKRRYGRFLDIRDAYCDLTFHEFLTEPEYEQARREA